MLKAIRFWIVTVVLVCVAGLTGLGAYNAFNFKFGYSEQVSNMRILTVLQKETPNQFIIAGDLEISTSVTATVSSGIDVGKRRIRTGETSVELTVPGKASYGFDLRALKPEDVCVTDGVVTLNLPPMCVSSVEPYLDKLSNRTDQGILQRLRSGPKTTAYETALGKVNDALRAQATEYVKNNHQPRINEAKALVHAVAPTFKASNIDARQYRFVFSTGEEFLLKP